MKINWTSVAEFALAVLIGQVLLEVLDILFLDKVKDWAEAKMNPAG